jgi:serine protease
MPLRARVLPILAASLAAALAAPSGAGAADYRPGEVVVRTADGRTRVHHIRDGSTVREKAAELARRPGVLSATPNFIARASFFPNDPGKKGQPGGWQATQWNLLPGTGIDAPGAWDNLIAAGRPGGEGVTVAVLDTGVAYRDYGPFRQSPDLAYERIRKGYDFVDNDPYPLDHNGHGTHVASTIAESADNGVGLVGIAYNASIMPVRVLDRYGEGDSVSISRGIRYAAKNGADIINLSFEFSSDVTEGQIPDILQALDYANQRGVLVVGASGNESYGAVAYPARAEQVLSVGAVTEHGCIAAYSNIGPELDVVAPGGGADARINSRRCSKTQRGRDIVQLTLVQVKKSYTRFGYPRRYIGTSMATPHVSGIAALVIASGVLGPDPSPDMIEAHLKATATDLGRKGWDKRYGAGLVNAARATAPADPPPPAAPEPTPAP